MLSFSNNYKFYLDSKNETRYIRIESPYIHPFDSWWYH